MTNYKSQLSLVNTATDQDAGTNSLYTYLTTPRKHQIYLNNYFSALAVLLVNNKQYIIQFNW